MKPKSSCQLCRQRHRRCITRTGAARCNGCDELDQECNFSPRFQFRPTRQISEKRTGKGRTGSSDKLRSPVELVFHSQGTEESLHSPSQAPATRSVGDRDETDASSIEERSPQIGPGDVSRLQDALPPTPHVDPESPESWRRKQLRSASLTSIEAGGSAGTEQLAPENVVEPSENRSASGLTQREAFLFRSWIQKIALVSDAVDDARHFAVVVPRLALEHPIILYGILALASRVDAVTCGSASDLESTYYHNRCIELLIESLSKPPETYDSTLLAVVVISRLYEENDTETDTKTHHLSGTRTLLSNEVVTRLAKEGGLAEAACWVHLRQAIYVAVVHRQHLDIPLGVYEALTAFRGSDNTSYANRAVYIFAQVLQAFFPDTAVVDASRSEDWAFLAQELNAWFEVKPLSFDPVYYRPPDADAGRPFPSMWMVSTVPTVALQHYYSGMIILCLRKCNTPGSTGGFEAARLRRHHERSVASYLCILMALALSNGEALNAWYLPCHMLDLCGYCIRHPTERAHTLQYLEEVKNKVQWKTAPVIKALKKQWAELDGYGS